MRLSMAVRMLHIIATKASRTSLLTSSACAVSHDGTFFGGLVENRIIDLLRRKRLGQITGVALDASRPHERSGVSVIKQCGEAAVRRRPRSARAPDPTNRVQSQARFRSAKRSAPPRWRYPSQGLTFC